MNRGGRRRRAGFPPPPGHRTPGGLLATVLLAAAALAALPTATAGAAGYPPLPLFQDPLFQDPLGPALDVTDNWAGYQPAEAFCIQPDAYEFSSELPSAPEPVGFEGGSGEPADGSDPACLFSGYGPDDEGLVRIEVGETTPLLCAGCHRIFLDYRQIPVNDPPLYYAHGRFYMRLETPNPSWRVDPTAHSPNIKNVSNDKAVVPDGSMQERPVWAFDQYGRGYTGDTAFTARTAYQGPYYVGPWYVNRAGERIQGAYLDVEVVGDFDAPSPPEETVGYRAMFNSGEMTCLDNWAAGGAYRGGNYFYGGCFDQGGASRNLLPTAT